MPSASSILPAERRRITRRVSRLIVLDRSDAVLLFRDSDWGLDPAPHWWITPGGGQDPGEDDRETAVRELREETGLALPSPSIVGPIASGRFVHGYSDVVVEQVEVYFTVRVSRFEPDVSEHTDEERACLIAHGWFTESDLAALDEPTWPARLRELITHARASLVDPQTPALTLPDTEESTVPA